ncbi:MAG: GIY-YIG nuclease family protein [Gammaproteobacteria bacterium]|nr:GIY-YIG nuclease family protein [Gammaproteobacteria bacterium]
MTGPNFSLYILRCADDSLYTGIASDVPRRIEEHEAGRRGAKYLRGKLPLRLEFSSEVGDRATASRLEYRVKQLSRAQKEALIDGRQSIAELLDSG